MALRSNTQMTTSTAHKLVSDPSHSNTSIAYTCQMSIVSFFSILSIFSIVSITSIASIASIASIVSIISITSIASIFSIISMVINAMVIAMNQNLEDASVSPSSLCISVEDFI